MSQFQIRHYEKGKITIAIVQKEEFNQNGLSQCLDKIHEDYGNNLEAIVHYVDSIELSPSGKEESVFLESFPKYLPPQIMPRYGSLLFKRRAIV